MAASSDVQIRWQDYLAVALRRKWCFVGPFAAAMLLGLCVALFAPRIYVAEALILVQSEKLINPLIQGLAMPTAINERLETLREEILSWSNLSRVIAAHGLDGKLPRNSPLAFERLVEGLRKDIRVKMRGESLIQVSYEGRDPVKVQELVNSLTDIVIARNTAIQEKEASTAVSFIETELTVYREKLEESERKLREFKELYMTEMPVATALNSQLKDLELQLSTLLIDNTKAHPRVVDIQRQIQEVRQRRDEEIRRLVARGVLTNDKEPELYQRVVHHLAAPDGADPEDEAVQKAQAAYDGLMEGLESPEVPQAGSQIAVSAEGTMIQLNDSAAASLTLAPRQQQELVRLTRDYSVNESIYRGLLEKLERAKITGRLGEDDDGGKFVVIERARFPLRPIKPKPLQVFVISLFAGLAFGIGAVVLAEHLDQSVQTADELSELLALPVLGEISSIVTPADTEERRRRQKDLAASFKDWAGAFLKTHMTAPIRSRVEGLLVRKGL